MSTAPSAQVERNLNWLALPALIFFGLFALVPLVGVFILSFTSWDGIGEIKVSGFESWIETLTKPSLLKAIQVTFTIMLFSWLVQTPISILLGAFTAAHYKYRNLLAVLYFLPLLLSSAAIAVAYRALLNPQFGLGAGLNMPWLSQDWLGKPTLAIGVVVFVVSWQFIPFHSLIYQGAIRQIPVALYEAATIDGAGRAKQFFSITLPQIKYTVITSSTLMVVGSLTFFDIIYVLTEGGPANSTRVLALDMFYTGFKAGEMGAASVIAVILVLVGLAMAVGVQRLGGKDNSASQLEGA